MVLGTGTGSFGAPITLLTPVTEASFAGDVNNDSKLDLVSGGTAGLTIMLGDGTGNLVRLTLICPALLISAPGLPSLLSETSTRMEK